MDSSLAHSRTLGPTLVSVRRALRARGTKLRQASTLPTVQRARLIRNGKIANKANKGRAVGGLRKGWRSNRSAA